MKYALLAYGKSDGDESGESNRDSMTAEEKRALHDSGVYAALSGSADLLAHYRLRTPRLTTTVRLSDNELTRTEGPMDEAMQSLCALFLVESEELEAVVTLAGQLPPIRVGGRVEIWPLIEPDTRGRHRHSGPDVA
jgi:hypothetical protein